MGEAGAGDRDMDADMVTGGKRGCGGHAVRSQPRGAPNGLHSGGEGGNEKGKQRREVREEERKGQGSKGHVKIQFGEEKSGL